MTMRPCSTCSRHFLSSEAACPFCQAVAGASDRPRLTKRLALGGLMLFTAVSATACYGTPPVPSPQNGNVIDYNGQLKPPGSDAAGQPGPSPSPGSSTQPGK